jgi:hypothetical protein
MDMGDVVIGSWIEFDERALYVMLLNYCDTKLNCAKCQLTHLHSLEIGLKIRMKRKNMMEGT